MIAILVLWVGLGFGQDAAPTLFETSPEGWRPEIIPFPLEFAPDLEYDGREELRFAPGMFDPEADDFFTYAFVWSLEQAPELDLGQLQADMLMYYKGLYEAVSKQKEKVTDGFSVILEKKPSSVLTWPNSAFKGSITWREPFKTELDQTLHLEIDQWACADLKRTVVYVLVSPQTFDHPIWEELRALRPFQCQD